jgi:hypothetical protein
MTKFCPIWSHWRQVWLNPKDMILKTGLSNTCLQFIEGICSNLVRVFWFSFYANNKLVVKKNF